VRIKHAQRPSREIVETARQKHIVAKAYLEIEHPAESGDEQRQFVAGPIIDAVKIRPRSGDGGRRRLRPRLSERSALRLQEIAVVPERRMRPVF
jgi:hypothetical protein